MPWRRLALEDPNHRNEWQLKEIRAFTAAAVRMAVREDREVAFPKPQTPQCSSMKLAGTRRCCFVSLAQVAFDLRLARYYMWAQTDYMVFVAVHVPTGVNGAVSAHV